MWKIIITFLAAQHVLGLATANVDQKVLSIDSPVSLLDSPVSLLDELYGELVESAESMDYKHKLINNGDVKITDYWEFTDSQMMLYETSQPFLNFHQLDSIQKSQAKETRMVSYRGYLKQRTKVKFPDNDDTTDILSRSLFGGIVTFGGFNGMSCFDPSSFNSPIDIAIVGAPFDTGTSYRPGARFGPEAMRLAAKRLLVGVTPVRGSKSDSKLRHVNPYDRRTHNLSIVDCGDVPMTPFDNRYALNQLYRGQRAIHNHTTGNSSFPLPKIITMGGDHTITLIALKLAYEKYGKVAVLHFDSHIDTWNPKVLGGGYSDYMSLNHGTFLHYAAENGYLETGKCFHLGLRAPYILPEYDIEHDKKCGFNTFTARDLDTLGVAKMVNQIKKTIGDLPVYISVDIDVLDPANAPGTGTMEIGGWTGRELLTILDALEGLNIIGADVVEVSPPFDTNSEVTSLAATAVIDSILGLIIVGTL